MIDKIAFFFETTYGLPHEVFYELVSIYSREDSEFTRRFIANFIKLYPKYCEKNGIVV